MRQKKAVVTDQGDGTWNFQLFGSNGKAIATGNPAKKIDTLLRTINRNFPDFKIVKYATDKKLQP